MSAFTRTLAIGCWLLLGMLATGGVQGASIKPLGEGGFAAIERHYAGRPLMVAIWSLECPPCMKELDLLGRLKEEYAHFNLVLINTDGLALAAEAGALLSSFGLSGADNWIFASNRTELLRYSIDPQWYGELPRSYIYHRGQRQGRSGLLDEAHLRQWLDSIAENQAGALESP